MKRVREKVKLSQFEGKKNALYGVESNVFCVFLLEFHYEK